MMKKIQHGCCRTPSGVRGLKLLTDDLICLVEGRTPSGVRGLKCLSDGDLMLIGGRTPSGVRGLKSLTSAVFAYNIMSHPVRGAWIEITV